MDGNARWAAEHGKSTLDGHRAGAAALKRTVRAAAEQGVEDLCVYAFSTENWNRPSFEVAGLMKMFGELIDSEVPELHDEGIRVRFIGRRDRAPKRLLRKIDWAEELTGNNRNLCLYVAFDYGGRHEILEAAAKYDGGGEEAFRSHLYAPEMRDPDIVIRTSGEIRLSNFLLWQAAYAELVFTDVLWPDFGADDLAAALAEYGARQRRFGAR